VNCVCPALIAGTGMMVDDDGGDEAVFLSKLNAFGRMGKQDEVVGIYSFLASDASTFITGQEICVDGGMSAGLGLPLFQAIG
jgi:NAD(P)-dependent dehydrogenase (short-subunit alcohol dehydrogenase family)